MPREFDKRSTQGNFCISKQERFTANTNWLPGPGAYQDENDNLWNKRTYNLLFNNEKMG